MAPTMKLALQIAVVIGIFLGAWAVMLLMAWFGIDPPVGI